MHEILLLVVLMQLTCGSHVNGDTTHSPAALIRLLETHMGLLPLL